jgi:hypothetical protein
MQPHDSKHQCSEASDLDGGRDVEQSAAALALGLVFQKALDAHYGAVHLAEPGKPLNLSANLRGSGGVSA